MNVDELDLLDLQSGYPPANGEMLEGMTLGRPYWLDRFQEHYLFNYIGHGHGSKVKLLVGGEGTGKTHLLRCVERDARVQGYEVVYISLKDLEFKLNNLPNLYRAIVAQIDKEKLVKGLCCRVAMNLGYESDEYDGSDRLLPLMVEREGWSTNDTIKEIRTAAGRTFRNLDAGPAFITFCYRATYSRLVAGKEATLRSVIRWLMGEKLERSEKQDTGLFETLQKSNARAWLNSLIHILNIAGMAGLVVMIDDLEEIIKINPETGRHAYTITTVKDTCELFRQLIDDSELLNSFVLLLAGRKEVIKDDKRGLVSYEALWNRLQTGLVPSDHFNPYCDIVDLDLHYATNGADFPQQVAERLSQLLQDAGFRRKYRDLPDLSDHNDLRARVIETAMMMEREAE
jgi:hypothetical protein